MTEDAARRPALILGAGSDIGLALAHLLAARGRPVYLAGREPAKLEAEAGDIALRHGVEASVHRFDAADLWAAAGFLDSLPEMPGVVVSAVGLLGDQEATQDDPERIAEVVTANFTGPAVALEAAAARLVRLPGETAVVGIGSVAGDRGRARNYWYGAAKAGFETMLSGLRQRYAGGNLLVMTVKPGFVATRMTEGMDLPGPLTLSAEDQARLILRGLDRRRPVVVHWKWRGVMAVIRNLPERVFLRTKF
ncbi:MAG: SDR family NAD(P)-dependent oxidoreductase [Pseudomonadota bacterium]